MGRLAGGWGGWWGYGEPGWWVGSLWLCREADEAVGGGGWWGCAEAGDVVGRLVGGVVGRLIGGREVGEVMVR